MSDPTASDESQEGGFAIGDLLGALRRRKWFVALMVTFGGLAATGVAYLLPNQYEAVATVQIDPRKKTIVSLDAVLPDIAGDTPTIESQVEILKSRDIALKVIEALRLRADPEFATEAHITRSAAQPAGTESLLAAARRATANADSASRISGPSQADIGSNRPERDDIAAEFASRLKTVRIRNSLVVEIAFRSNDPVKAARIANTIAEVYIRDQIDMKMRATGLAAELLGPKLEGLREKVADAERKVARYKAENGIIDAEGQLLSEKHISRLLEQAVAARNGTAEARAKFEQMQAVVHGGASRNIGDVLQSQTIRLLKEQHAKATKQEAELLTKYGSKHPEISRARAQIADIEGQISRETDQIIANVKSDYEVAGERERMLESSLAQLKEQQSVTKEIAVKLHDLEREVEASRRVFESFLGRYRQTVESQDLQLPDSRIVEKADVPFAPVFPKRKQIILLGLIAGFLLGAGIVVVVELLRTGVSHAEEAEAILGIPLLASLPLARRYGEDFADAMLAVRLVLAQPAEPLVRSIIALRDGLDRRRTTGGARIILLTASLPNEGTTFVAANLALAFAATQHRTLLIDANLRRSQLTHHYTLHEAPGLVDAIGLGQDFENVILRDTVSGLSIIPAGDVGRFPLSPQEALEAPGFAQRLNRLKAHFDTILIDSPPLLPVTDARILASYADEIILVATWQKTPRHLMRKAMRLIESSATRITGIVLNRMEDKAAAPSKSHRRRAGKPPELLANGASSSRRAA